MLTELENRSVNISTKSTVNVDMYIYTSVLYRFYQNKWKTFQRILLEFKYPSQQVAVIS